MPGQAVASYDGQQIFGRAIRMRTVINPPADQLNNFFGANGQESLFGGTRGRVTEVEGVLFGPTIGALAAFEELFISYNDGKARTLVDDRGVVYQYVKFGAFQPGERIMPDPVQGYFRTYKAVFNHLI